MSVAVVHLWKLTRENARISMNAYKIKGDVHNSVIALTKKLLLPFANVTKVTLGGEVQVSHAEISTNAVPNRLSVSALQYV